MTPEQPPISLRHPRPGVAARRRALGLDVPVPPTRESLRDSLARIPDLGDSGVNPIIKAALAVAPAGDPPESIEVPAVAPAGFGGARPPAAVPPSAEASSAPPAPAAVTAAPEPEVGDAEERLAAAVAADLAAGGDGSTIRPIRASGTPPMWRRVVFSVVLIALVASIPVLGVAGYRVIRDSKAGSFSEATLSPSDPGYEAQVEPTPTAVAIQFDDQGLPNGLTFLSLAGDDKGGAVIFVPLDTQVTEPSFGVNKLRTAYKVVADRPALARERLASQVGRLLNVGIEETIELDNDAWTKLVAPFGDLTIDNPDDVDLGGGVVIPAGTATLKPDQVGPYLAALKPGDAGLGPGESDLNRLNRHEVVWEAWLKLVRSSGKQDQLPGESSTGMGRFARALASGTVSYDTLPVDVVPGLAPEFKADKSAVAELITNTVASPTAAVPGSRFTVRLLNGVSADPIPSDLVRQVVGRGGAVTTLGNGPAFGADDTTIVYADPADKNLATLLAKSIGATGTVRLDREAPDTVDLTIVLGRDILGDTAGIGVAGGTSPDTTRASGGD